VVAYGGLVTTALRSPPLRRADAAPTARPPKFPTYRSDDRTAQSFERYILTKDISLIRSVSCKSIPGEALTCFIIFFIPIAIVAAWDRPTATSRPARAMNGDTAVDGGTAARSDGIAVALSAAAGPACSIRARCVWSCSDESGGELD
jgi:hypothetical protein